MIDPTLLQDPEGCSAPELAALVDSYAGIRKRKAELNKEVDRLAEDGERIRVFLLAAMDAQGLSALGGHIASVSVKVKSVPRPADWGAIYEHIQRTGEFDLLHRRLADTAVRTRWQHGENIPGVESTDVRDLSVSSV